MIIKLYYIRQIFLYLYLYYHIVYNNSMDNRNIIYYIIIISIIIFLVHSIYAQNNNTTKIEKFSNKNKNNKNESENIQGANMSISRKDYRFIDYDEKLPWNWESEVRPCPVVEDNENY